MLNTNHRMRLTSLVVLAMTMLALAALGASVARADPSADAPTLTDCPASYALLSVSGLEAIGPYRLPRLVDSAGNGDGLVCGLQMPDTVRDADCKTGGTIACLLGQLGLPLYRFKDNHVTAGH